MKNNILIALLLILCSCSLKDKIYLKEITQARITQINSEGILAQVKMVVVNESSHKVEILSVDYELFKGKQKLGTGSMDGKINIDKRSSLEYDVALRLVVERDFFAKIGALSADRSPLELQAVIIAKSGLLRKRITLTQTFGNEILRELLPTFGL